MNGGGWTGLVVGGLTGLGTGSFGGFLAMAVIGRLVEIICYEFIFYSWVMKVIAG